MTSEPTWYDCNFERMDTTSQLLLLFQAAGAVTYRSLKSATDEARDEIDRHVLKLWSRSQTMLGERLARERDEGLLTDEQFDYILDWLGNWIEYGPDEAGELLRAWLVWTGRWRDCSTQPASTADTQRQTASVP